MTPFTTKEGRVPRHSRALPRRTSRITGPWEPRSLGVGVEGAEGPFRRQPTGRRLVSEDKDETMKGSVGLRGQNRRGRTGCLLNREPKLSYEMVETTIKRKGTEDIPGRCRPGRRATFRRDPPWVRKLPSDPSGSRPLVYSCTPRPHSTRLQNTGGRG